MVHIILGTEHIQLLCHLHVVISERFLAIPKIHGGPITSLRTSSAKELELDKNHTSYDDLLDGLRLSLRL